MDCPNMKATIADPISAPIDTVDPIDPTANTADPVVNPMNDSIDPSNHGLSLPTNDLSTDNADIYEPSQMTSAPSLSSSTENIQVGTSDDVSTPLTNPSDQEQLPVVDYPSLTVPSPTYLPEMDDKETEELIDTDHFADEQEHVYPPDDSSEADYNFDVDIDELDKTTAESAPTPPTVSSPQPVLPSLHVQRRTSSQEGGNVTDISTSEHKQPIEVQYNLPNMYKPNKKRFKPQLANKRKKKTKLNLIRARKLPLEKTKPLLE